MDLGLSGKVALITGSGSGIGQHMAAAFAQEGAKVAVNDISAKGIEDTLRMVGDAGVAAQCDITDTAAVAAMVAAVEKKAAGDLGIFIGKLPAAISDVGQLFVVIGEQLVAHTRPHFTSKLPDTGSNEEL